MHNPRQGYFIIDPQSVTTYIHAVRGEKYQVPGKPVCVNKMGGKREILVLVSQEDRIKPSDSGMLTEVAVEASRAYNKEKGLVYDFVESVVDIIPAKIYHRAKDKIFPEAFDRLLKNPNNDVPYMNGFKIFDGLEFARGLNIHQKDGGRTDRRLTLSRVVYAPCVWTPTLSLDGVTFTTNATL